MRLLPEGARIHGGAILFDGADLLKLSEPAMRAIRGAQIAMIFQEPMTSLNPVFTIGSQIGESLRPHQRTARRETRARTVQALHMVGIADPQRPTNHFPPPLSARIRHRATSPMPS